MNKKQLIIVFSVLFLICTPAFAYLKNYPPHKFKDGIPKHLQVKALVDINKAEYKSKDGDVSVKLKERPNAFDFILKQGNLVLAKIKEKEMPVPYAVYWADLDNNGLKDFMVFYNYKGTDLEGFRDRVDIFLKVNKKTYQRISYDTMSAGLEDFVDLNKDGKYEVVITDLYKKKKHNYFTYNIYEFKNYKLVNANANFKGFPKFIWMTYKSNDKDTAHLTKEEREKYVAGINNSIEYQEIK